MSVREKFAWVSFLSTVAIWSPYFVFTFARIQPGDPGMASIFGAFVAAVVVQALITSVAGLAIKLTSVAEPKDERDLVIEARALKVAYYVMIVSVFSVVCLSAYVAGSVESSPVKGVATVVMISQ